MDEGRLRAALPVSAPTQMQSGRRAMSENRSLGFGLGLRTAYYGTDPRRTTRGRLVRGHLRELSGRRRANRSHYLERIRGALPGRDARRVAVDRQHRSARPRLSAQAEGAGRAHRAARGSRTTCAGPASAASTCTTCCRCPTPRRRCATSPSACARAGLSRTPHPPRERLELRRRSRLAR